MAVGGTDLRAPGMQCGPQGMAVTDLESDETMENSGESSPTRRPCWALALCSRHPRAPGPRLGSEHELL